MNKKKLTDHFVSCKYEKKEYYKKEMIKDKTTMDIYHISADCGD